MSKNIISTLVCLVALSFFALFALSAQVSEEQVEEVITEPEVQPEAMMEEEAVTVEQAEEPISAVEAQVSEEQVEEVITEPEIQPEAVVEEKAVAVEQAEEPAGAVEGFDIERGGYPEEDVTTGETGAEEAVLAEVPSEALPEAEILTPQEMLAVQEEVRRQAQEVEALKNFDHAYNLMKQNEFEKALKLFNDGLNIMPKRPHTVVIRQKAKRSQAECEYRIALMHYRQGELDLAYDATRNALGYYPSYGRAIRLNQRIKREQAIARLPKEIPPGKAIEYREKRKRIKKALKLGEQYMRIGEYEKAKYELRQVLLEDDLNPQATANLEKIAEKEYRLASDKMRRMSDEMLASVRETWTPPVRQEITAPPRAPEGGPVMEASRRRLIEKLNKIVIPELDFRQANIVDVIKYLDQQAYAGDTESAPAERGVNIILNLKRPGGAQAYTPSRGEEELFAPSGEEAPAIVAPGVPLITLSLRNIVLMDAIKYIAEVTGLKYRIEKNVVIITPADVVYGKVITRTYKVQPTIEEVISGAALSEGVTTGLGVELGVMRPAERKDVKSFFVEAGVPFPEGTAIVYKPSISLLIVSNTAENLERFEQILATLNVIPQQVEIEARFVEISQADLAELGIQWMLTDNWEIAQDASASATTPLTSRERVQINKNAITKGLRYLGSGGTGPAAINAGDMAGILSVSSILTNPEFTFILHALEQSGRANLLSAPKVTTKSGANAEIKVVEELIYPTEFDQEVQSVGVGGGEGTTDLTQVVVTPSGFEIRDVGVVLNVTPVVAPDGYTIDLTMLPQVVELNRWIDYGTSLTRPDGTIQTFSMPQPIFYSRTIATSISIWDGQTVVMGGLITEKQVTTTDKVPFLGDIPLLGRLFQSKTTHSRKANLLIFVTAYLVDPAGNRLNKTGAVALSHAGTSAPLTP